MGEDGGWFDRKKSTSSRLIYARLKEGAARLAKIGPHLVRLARNPAATAAQRWSLGNHVAARAAGREGDIPFSLKLITKRIRQKGAAYQVNRMSELVRLEVATTDTLLAHELQKGPDEDPGLESFDEVEYERELPKLEKAPKGPDSGDTEP